MKSGLLSVVITTAIIAMSSNSFALTNCQKLFAKYQQAHGHKAFATTMGNDPGYHPTSCSLISNFSFKKLAEKKVISECNKVRRPEDGGACKVISSQ